MTPIILMIFLWFFVFFTSKTYFSKQIISNNYCLITGATGNVGLALSKQLHLKGAKLICTGRDESKLLFLKQAYKAITIQFDINDVENFPSAFEQALNEYKVNQCEVKHVFLNHGYGYFGQFVKQNNIQRYLQVNQYSFIVLAHYLLQSFSLNSITITSSCIAYIPSQNYTLYHISKRAISSFVKSLRKEMKNVNISAVHPGTINGPFFDHSGMENSQQGIRKLGQYKFFSSSPEYVAKQLIYSAETGKDLNPSLISKLLKYAQFLQ
ncbi:Short-chain dehydrogenase/reductase [Spironucleus salmonicida]|uniref:Short-chain dehydrogenase/reductase n=1 Tax=Spironucleus salmonicida TaxID=348837 RepID=V6LMB5_9EUKA|nr:Short-chain dehydrogenase/reductase [Spironucleus salmonicida]|eukprot:EST45775.1 Short-chain dehydrogenase/reductase [Spironucleus salmonicida]